MADLTRVFKALSDDTRLSMMKLLLPGARCVCEIMDALDLSQSRASRNLGILKTAGLVKDCRKGQWVYYCLDMEAITAYPGMLELLHHNLGTEDAERSGEGRKEIGEAVRL